MILILPMTGITQNKYYLKMNLNPGYSWKSNEPSKIKYVNSFGILLGRRCGNKFSLETGLGLSKAAYKLIRTVEVIGVIDNFNSYILEGEIPVKQKITDRFIEVPFQINYILKPKKNISLSIYSRASMNFTHESIRENWYYYKTDDEFSTKNTFINSRGKHKFAFSYQLGFFLQKKIYKKISLGIGLNYRNLFHKHKFPLRAESRVFHNVSGEINVIYELIKREENE